MSFKISWQEWVWMVLVLILTTSIANSCRLRRLEVLIINKQYEAVEVER